MKRRREQLGTVYEKGGVWYLRYSDYRVIDGQLRRKRLAKQIGLKSDFSKKQAREEGKRFLSSINSPTLQPETAVTLVSFIDSVYLRISRSAQGHQPFGDTRFSGMLLSRSV